MSHAEVSWDLAWSYFVQPKKGEGRNHIKKLDTERTIPGLHERVSTAKQQGTARHSTAQYRTARQGTAR